MFSLSIKLPQIKQSGFAIIPIFVVLLIAGIATGVYLTQSGTSFLPQAQEAGTIQIKWSNVCSSDNKRFYYITQGQKSLESDVYECDAPNRPCTDYIKSYCGKYGMRCAPTGQGDEAKFSAQCVPATVSQTVEKCVVQNGAIVNPPTSNCPASGQKFSISHCDFNPDSSYKVIGDDCLNLQNPQNFTYYCYWDKQCSGQPAAPAATSPEISKKCDDKETAKCAAPNKGCYIIDEKIRCVYEKATCTQKEIEFCQDPSDGDPREGCEVGNATIADGKVPVQYTKCTAAKRGSGAPAGGTPAAGSQTEVPDVKCADPNHPVCTTNSTKEYGVDKGVCYMINSNLRCAYSKDYKSYDSANGPCNAEDNKACKDKGGCTLVKVTIKGQSDPIQYSICKNDTAARPAAPAPAAAAQPRSGATAPAPAAGNPRPGSPAQPAAAAPAAATAPKPVGDLICGKDTKGIDIPCYAMGVFSTDELSQREAQATLASVNYAKFREIIDREESKVGATIANNARAKVEAAEREVKACLEKK